MLEIGFTTGEIGGLVVAREGDMVGFADVVGLEGGDRVLAVELGESLLLGEVGVEVFELVAEGIRFGAKRLVSAIACEKNKEERANNGKTDDDEGPEKAHLEVLVIVDDVEGDGEREENCKNSDRKEVAIEKKI